jgi:WD40 repeat protein
MTGGRGVTYMPTCAELIVGQAEIQAGWPASGPWRLKVTDTAPMIRSLAVIEVPTGPVAILGAEDGTVVAVELATGKPFYQKRGQGKCVTAITCDYIAGRPIALLNYGSSEYEMLDMISGNIFKVDRFQHYEDAGESSAVIVSDGSLLEVSGKSDGTVKVRSSRDSFPNLPPFTDKHDGPVTVVACGYLNDQPTAFTGGDDGKVRVWDLASRRMLDVIDVGDRVFAIEVTANGDLLVGAGGEAISFRHASASQPPRDLT